ncbi:hypothetical protein PVAP13_2KG342002 [Panicum virgatum]|uniref:Uncharacterized protein n=1 Tax=Panicum virgatum TaxID=38727 RepID=A0A8T0W8R0_PANVG|nr:hypothetical protein PVAP13_2KG342002 [Panicum virgatum]
MAYRAARGGEGWRRGEVMPRWGEAVQAVLLLRRRRRPGRRLRGRVRSGGGPRARARPLAPPPPPPPSSPSAVDVAWRAGASRSRCSGGGGGGRPTPRTETAGTTAAASGRAARGEREREWAVGRRWVRRGGAGEGRAAAQVAGRRRCGVPPAACSNPSCSPRLRKGGRVAVAAAHPQPPQPNGWCWAAERLG